MGKTKPDPERPVAAWSEKDLLDDKIVDAFVVIFRSPGCYWSKQSGCLMCGYNNDCLSTVTPENLITQFQKAMEKYAGQKYFKLYTSGSFFDQNEIGIQAQEKILAMVGERAKKILVESRPEFVNQKALDRVFASVEKLEIAIGLETANDDIRCKSINKGFKFADFERAAKLARKNGARIRTYLILKPPYITESEAIADTLESIKIAGPLSDVISVNPMNIQNYTVVEGLWKKSLYRPPWLWSLVEVLKKANELTDVRVISAPSGGGSRRGVHNCRKCDKEILAKVDEFSLNQDADVFNGLKCQCKEKWLDYLDVETHMGTTGHLTKLAKPE
ncbi:MAG: archaeosine biosynthesis radical SAM protein RaSEA [Thermoplasmata archaeon]|nr:archaeosine biosynthesis radical SAM protein RaSEA [Thermoplasmata archaeon]